VRPTSSVAAAKSSLGGGGVASIRSEIAPSPKDWAPGGTNKELPSTTISYLRPART
jgi:hypothetical protein